MERPDILDLSRAADRARLEVLEASGRVHRRHDALRLQLVELVQTRARGRALPAPEIEARVGKDTMGALSLSVSSGEGELTIVEHGEGRLTMLEQAHEEP